MRFSSWCPLRSVITATFLTGLAVLAPAQQNIWTSHGPTGVGLVNDIAVGDSAAYAAALNGVFRSNDGGANWVQTGLAGEHIYQVLTRPGTPVVLATMWDPDFENGILHSSQDEGMTWATVAGLPGIILAAVDPWDLSIYVGARDGTIWRSTDGGGSWRLRSTTPTNSWARSFAFDSHAIYIQSFDDLDSQYKFYQTLDGGASWTTVSSPTPYSSALAAGAAPGHVYIGGDGIFCRSTDSAATWTCSNFPEYPLRIVEVPDDGSGAGPRILAASLGVVYVSRDQGATWARGDGEFGSVGSVPALASDSSGSLVLAGTDLGILRSLDRGNSFTPSRAGLRSSVINALALDPQDPSTLWAGGYGFDGENSGLFRSADGGLSWSLGSGPATWLSGGALLVDPEHPSTLYAGGSAVYRSDDGGAHWTTAAVPGSYVTALALDPESPERIWAASYAGLFRSDDGARSFASPSAVAQEVYSILFDARRPSTIYAGSYYDIEPGYYGYPFGGSLFVSRDGGATWTKNSRDVGSPVYAIATDPFQDRVLYAGTYTGVFRSADDGESWEWPAQALTIGRVISLVADPVRPGRLYAATDSGVYRTTDGARTWHLFSSGLGSLPAQPIVITPDGRWLHAGTQGGGVFSLDLETELSPLPCTQSATRLCLVGNRYAVELAAHRGEGPSNPGIARPLSDRAGYFSLPFATGDSQLPEVVVKMLADGAFQTSGAPIFYSSLTTLPYVFTVTDTATGRVEVYASNPDAPLCGGADLPFGSAEASVQRLSAPATVGEAALRLLGGRFSVTLEARHPGSGQIANGVVMSAGDRFGFFSLPDFTGDPQFPEVAVKMVDFRAVTGKFWFFYTGLTSLDYTLTVTDAVTGAVRIYESTSAFCGAADTKAFTD